MNEDAAASKSTEAVSKRIQTTVEEREQWARRFAESGLSLRKFSAQHGLHWYSLWRWVDRRRQFAEREADGELQTFEFTEIKLPDSKWVAELSLPGGKVLRVSKDVSQALLEQLLGVC